jgi:hypothetical protein
MGPGPTKSGSPDSGCRGKSCEHLDAKAVGDKPGEKSKRKSLARDTFLRFEEFRKQRLIGDVRYWRDRAKEKRREAECTLRPITRANLLDTAEGYEALASQIEQRLGEAV